MNAKKAKALRKLLRNAQNLNEKNKQPVPQVAYYEMEKRRKYIEVPDPEHRGEVQSITSDFGSGVETKVGPVMKKIQVAPGQLVVAPKSIRGIYKRLKKKIDEQASKTARTA